ncbi:hypothetical protein OBBRIDRAFT_838414 [Obba rivulosa]|uniref:Uncharacterized protein n=1 Tax=Obba rivulosa TaxID=1052685 RepID=A0A8E2AK96_9APHY|nr:hypothetical protein OBBRIDRAFT_838414 [Obba rivulosa]
MPRGKVAAGGGSVERELLALRGYTLVDAHQHLHIPDLLSEHMSTLAAGAANSPQPFPSLPPSPVEEDISRAAWAEESSSSRAIASGSTGKGKARAVEPFDEDEPERGDHEPLHEEDADAIVDGYPPTNDEEEETRRVEENLRRWEIAERERRKASRESTNSSTNPPSLIGDVTRRVSLLWPTRQAKQATSSGVGAHHALRTTDDAVPLDDIEGSPAASAAPSPALPPTANPFLTPNPSVLSLSGPQSSAIMTPTDSPGTANVLADKTNHARTGSRAAQRASKDAKERQLPPPPEPLDLPRPRSPPPRGKTPHADRPPEPIPPPAAVPVEQEQEPKPVRWWTEWLCGCSEGPDRGGDHQAGRTNPFE